MHINIFKRDHDAILVFVKKLRELAQAGVVQNSVAISEMIDTMSSRIKVHLAIEDRILYPALLKSSDPAIVNISKIFQSEMNGIAAAYIEFARKWNNSYKVAANPDEFKKEADAIFEALHQRIQRENKELYPLAESF